MRRTHTVTALGLAMLGLALLLPGLVSAEDAATIQAAVFPYGRYEGSAIGSGQGGGAQKAIAVTVWLNDNGDGTIKITGTTPDVPIPVSAEPAAATAVPGGWDIPVAVRTGVNGSGTLRIRLREDGWHMWADGTGTFRGKSGGGRGHAKHAGKAGGLLEQVGGALGGFFGASDPGDPQAPEPYPEGEFASASEPVEPAPGSTPDDEGDTLAKLLELGPIGVLELLLILVLMLIAMIILASAGA